MQTNSHKGSDMIALDHQTVDNGHADLPSTSDGKATAESSPTLPPVDSTGKPLRRAVLFLISLFLLAVIVLIALNHWDLLGEGAFGREIGKTSLQVIAVAVLGTTASLLLAAFNHHREERLREQDRDRRLDENKDQLRKEIL